MCFLGVGAFVAHIVLLLCNKDLFFFLDATLVDIAALCLRDIDNNNDNDNYNNNDNDNTLSFSAGCSGLMSWIGSSQLSSTTLSQRQPQNDILRGPGLVAPETKEMINNCFAALDGYTRREREIDREQLQEGHQQQEQH